jgi:uridine kinase
MRKNIGWQEKTDDAKYEIRVIFDGGDRIRWQRITKAMERWETFAPTPDHWQTLLEKTQARYVRRQAPYKDLLLVERLAARAITPSRNQAIPPSPPPP